MRKVTIASTLNVAPTLTAGRTLAQTFLIELHRFFDAVLKPDSRDDASGPFHWGRGL